MSVRHFTNPLKPKKETPGTNKSLQKRTYSRVHVHTSTRPQPQSTYPLLVTPPPPADPARLLHFRLLWLAEARCIDHVRRVFNRRIRALATGTTPRPPQQPLPHDGARQEVAGVRRHLHPRRDHYQAHRLAPGGCGISPGS